MAEHNVNVTQRAFESPIRTKWVGGRSWFIAIAVVGMWINIAGINSGVKESNKLEKQKLEEMRKQYALDSLKFEYTIALSHTTSQKSIGKTSLKS